MSIQQIAATPFSIILDVFDENILVRNWNWAHYKFMENCYGNVQINAVKPWKIVTQSETQETHWSLVLTDF